MNHQVSTLGRRALTLLTTVLALGFMLLGAGPASAVTGVGAQDAVGPHASSFQASVGLPERIVAGQGRVSTTVYGQSAVATGVAANTADDVGSLVPYDAQAASRTLLGQVGDGFATTPGGRTVSAHAAERIVQGAPGRPPTTLERVDDILDNPTKIKYDPVRDTVRVSQGRAWVVVRGSGPQQHIVTVMIPGRK